MSISQFFILSKDGDIVFYRDFQNIIKKSNKIFVDNIITSTQRKEDEDENIPYIININGINYIYKKIDSLYFVISTLDNVSPNYYLEVINYIMRIINDYVKNLTEGLIKKNLELINEIIDELINFGYPQLSDSENIKEFIFTKPVTTLIKSKFSDIKEVSPCRRLSSESCRLHRSANVLICSLNNNEIFTDIIEKISCLFNKDGKMISWGIDGSIKIKCSFSHPAELKIVLSDNIITGNNVKNEKGKIKLTGYNFGQGVKSKEFEDKRTLYITPYEKEFILMNYRIDNKFMPPFKLFLIVDESDYKLELKIKVIANYDNNIRGINIVVNFNAPKDTKDVIFDLSEKYEYYQKVNYNEKKRLCTWEIPRMLGYTQIILETKFNLKKNNPSKSRKELGPINMSFELINYITSGIEIKGIKVISDNMINGEKKWIRKYTKVKSYVIRFD